MSENALNIIAELQSRGLVAQMTGDGALVEHLTDSSRAVSPNLAQPSNTYASSLTSMLSSTLLMWSRDGWSL